MKCVCNFKNKQWISLNRRKVVSLPRPKWDQLDRLLHLWYCSALLVHGRHRQNPEWKPRVQVRWYFPLLVPFILWISMWQYWRNSVGIRRITWSVYIATLWGQCKLGEAFQHAQSSCWNTKTKYKMTHLTLVVSNHWTGLCTRLVDWIVE